MIRRYGIINADVIYCMRLAESSGWRVHLHVFLDLYKEGTKMACFLVPAAEAVITTIATKVMQKKEKAKTPEKLQVKLDGEQYETVEKQPFSTKMKWLNHLLWGGSGLLAFEHLWHGEVVPWAPFLTAMESSDSTTEMLNEMSTVGVSMTVLVTVIWGGMVAVSSIMEKKAMAPKTDEQ